MELKKLIEEYKLKIKNAKECAKKLVDIIPFVPKELDGTVCAVDSGVHTEEFGGIVYGRIKCVAVLFEYKNGSLKKSFVYPKKPLIKDVVFTGESAKEDVSIERHRIELELLLECSEQYQPEICFFDGSLIPKEGKEKLKEIVDKGIKRGVVGIVKNSSSNLISKRCGLQLSDQLLLASVMPTYSYTKPMEYEGVKFSYLKARANIPIRLESKDLSINKIGWLCDYSKTINYPAVLFEADRKARIRHYDIEEVEEIKELKLKRLFRNIR